MGPFASGVGLQGFLHLQFSASLQEGNFYHKTGFFMASPISHTRSLSKEKPSTSMDNELLITKKRGSFLKKMQEEAVDVVTSLTHFAIEHPPPAWKIAKKEAYN